MGIRGDMEARYWAELGHDKPRQMAEYFFDCLNDPNVWQGFGPDYTNEQIMTFLEMLGVIKGKILTFTNADRDELAANRDPLPAADPI